MNYVVVLQKVRKNIEKVVHFLNQNTLKKLCHLLESHTFGTISHRLFTDEKLMTSQFHPKNICIFFGGGCPKCSGRRRERLVLNSLVGSSLEPPCCCSGRDLWPSLAVATYYRWLSWPKGTSKRDFVSRVLSDKIFSRYLKCPKKL